jgi:hypothetical protein
LYVPASLLTAVVLTPVAVLVAVTVTPGNTARDGSSIVPLTVALLIWPNACRPETENRTTMMAIKDFLIVPPFISYWQSNFCEIMVAAKCCVNWGSIPSK